MFGSVYMPEIVSVNFPEGTFDFIWCDLCVTSDGEGASFYPAFIGIGVDIEDMTKVSEQLSLFDAYKVFTYVPNLQDFFQAYIEGMDWYRIVNYEVSEESLPLFDQDEWDEVKNDYNFWVKVESWRGGK